MMIFLVVIMMPKNYLLVFCIKDWYELFINNLLYKLLMNNYNNLNNVNCFIKLGKVDSSNLSLNQVFKDNLMLKNCLFNDVVWMYEKNYSYSIFFMWSYFFLNKIMEDQFFSILNNFELFKMLFGKNIMEEYFNDEINEFEDIVFMMLLWYEFFSKNFMMNKNIIPLSYKSNYEYDKIFNLSKFLSQYDKVSIPFLDYSMNFESSFTLNIMMNDSFNEYKNFKKKDELMNLYMYIDVNLNDEYTKLSLEIYSNNLYSNNEMSFNNLKMKSKVYFDEKMKLFMKNLNFLELILFLSSVCLLFILKYIGNMYYFNN